MLAPVVFVLALPAFAARPVSGVVINKTTNKPVADKTVLLMRRSDMSQLTTTVSDNQGRFTFDLPDEGTYFAEVMYDKVLYAGDALVPAQSNHLDVYDSGAHVKGITGEADVMRIETGPDGQTLDVVENFFIKNASTPPLTQFSDRPFEFVLPEGAVVDASAALGPGGVPVPATPVPLPEKNHYTFDFALLPGHGGETRFQLTYHLPYDGSQAFSPSPSIPMDTLVVMLPKSMSFKADSPSPYSPLTQETTAQTYLARSVNPGQAVGFTISGTGVLPENADATAGNQPQPFVDADVAAGASTEGKPNGTAAGSPGTSSGGTITGVVINKTTNKPSAGDDVVLIPTQQVSTKPLRTRTDAQGRFTLQAPDSGLYLFSVEHDKASYFRTASPGTKSVEIDVFDAVEHVDGLTGRFAALRIETTGNNKSLHVLETFFIENKSMPPVAQFSKRPFEFVLPDGAVIENSDALGPAGVPVQSPPVPLQEKNHYTFDFPVAPGETRFEIEYMVPYNGSLKFAPTLPVVTDLFIIFIPRSMELKADAGTPYTHYTGERVQSFVGQKVPPSQALGFTLSGEGQIPPDAQNPYQGSKGETPQAAPTIPENGRGAFLYQSCQSFVQYAETPEDHRTIFGASEANVCSRYVAGYLDAIVYSPQPHHVCVEGVEIGSVVRTYISYMQSHPEEMTANAGAGLMETLLTSYHCSAQN